MASCFLILPSALALFQKASLLLLQPGSTLPNSSIEDIQIPTRLSGAGKGEPLQGGILGTEGFIYFSAIPTLHLPTVVHPPQQPG